MLRLGDVTNTFLRYAIRIAIYNPVNRLQNAIKTNTKKRNDTFSVVPTKTKKIVVFKKKKITPNRRRPFRTIYMCNYERRL